MPQKHETVLARDGRNQAVRIPREFEFSCNRVIVRKIGRRLILEPAPRQKLADVLGKLKPLGPDEIFPDIDRDLPPLDEE